METLKAQRLDARSGRGRSSLVSYTGAAAFVAAAVWYGLAVQGVTVASEPVFSPSQTLPERREILFRWFVLTLPQERLYTAIALAGFLCLAVTAIVIRDRFAQRPLSVVAVSALPAGVALWVVGNVLQLGGHRAVGMMATHGNPLETVGSIHFTIELIDDAFELASFAFLGVGMLAFGWIAVRRASIGASWGRYTILVGLAMLGTAASYAADNGDVTNILLLTGGVVLLPAWLAWTGRLASKAPHDESAA
jgi:hypothetical protein